MKQAERHEECGCGASMTLAGSYLKPELNEMFEKWRAEHRHPTEYPSVATSGYAVVEPDGTFTASGNAA